MPIKKTPRKLNDVLDLSIEMWKWISKEYEMWEWNIEALKEQWLRDHAYATEWNGPESDCFFCQYALDHDGSYDGKTCPQCPGKLIDPVFNCLDPEYDYLNHPEKFYKKLLSLRQLYRKQFTDKKNRRSHRRKESKQ